MPRTLSEITKAIRQLIDEHGFELTHTEARPMLEKMGEASVPKPPRRSSENTVWEDMWKQYEKPKNEDEIAVVVEAVRKDLKITKAAAQVFHEARLVQEAWKTEANHFNVSKGEYRKTLNDRRIMPSTKPAKSRNTKAITAAAVAKTIKTFGESGRGRKQCPSCSAYVAARSAVCVCGHDFVVDALPPHKYGPNGKPTTAKATKQPKVAKQPNAEIAALLFVEKSGGMLKVQAHITDLEAQLVVAKEAVELVEELQKRVAKAAA